MPPELPNKAYPALVPHSGLYLECLPGPRWAPRARAPPFPHPLKGIAGAWQHVTNKNEKSLLYIYIDAWGETDGPRCVNVGSLGRKRIFSWFSRPRPPRASTAATCNMMIAATSDRWMTPIIFRVAFFYGHLRYWSSCFAESPGPRIIGDSPVPPTCGGRRGSWMVAGGWPSADCGKAKIVKLRPYCKRVQVCDNLFYGDGDPEEF